jgi:NADPH2:quinone reductase
MPLNLTLLKSCQIVGVFWGAFIARAPAQHLANVQELLALYARGAIRPAISARFSLAEGGQAIAALAERRAQGKLVVMLEG